MLRTCESTTALGDGGATALPVGTTTLGGGGMTAVLVGGWRGAHRSPLTATVLLALSIRLTFGV